MRVSHVLLDMDGVIVDFAAGALAEHNRLDVLQNWPAREWSISRILNISEEEFWDPLRERGESFWRNLAPYPWFAELMTLIQSRCDFTVASSPSTDPYSSSGKVHWMQDRFDPHFHNFMLGARKYHMAQPDYCLIDDNDRNVELFRAKGGQAILFPQPWNANHGLVATRMAYVASEFCRMTEQHPVLGISGYAQSGKDSAALALCKQGWQRVAFADPLRTGVYRMNPRIRLADGSFAFLQELVDAVGWDEAKKNPEVRRWLQIYGTEAGRDIHGADCWLRLARKALLAAAAPVVITDVRFANEAELIRSLGGKLIRIQRPGVGPLDGHVSEKQPFEPDAYLENNGTLEDLEDRILDYVAEQFDFAVPV